MFAAGVHEIFLSTKSPSEYNNGSAMTSSAESNIPNTPPERAGPRIVALFYTDYIASVKKWYKYLEESSQDPLKISLSELQMEVMIFGLHCLDRVVLVHWGAEYRAAFMDHALDFVYEKYAAGLPDYASEQLLKSFSGHCQTRHREYSAMKLFPTDGGALKGVLSYEFSKLICFNAGVHNPAAGVVMVEAAHGIFMTLFKVTQTL
jgi:hypothetical protein